MRRSADIDQLADYRRFIDEIASQRNGHNAKRTDFAPGVPRPLLDRRTSDYEKTIVAVTPAGGSTLSKVSYIVPSRLIGQRLRVRVYDDRPELFIGGTALMTLPHGRSGNACKHGLVIGCRHFMHALKRKWATLLNLVNRQQLFPRGAYWHMFDYLLAYHPERQACRTMVSLSLLAEEGGCEAELAGLLDADRTTSWLPNMASLWTRFAPDAASLPEIHVQAVPLAAYQDLLDGSDASYITYPSAHGQEQVASPAR